jgi:protein TonB
VVLNRDDALFGGLVTSFSVIGAAALCYFWAPPSLPQPLAPRNVAVHFAAAPAAAPAPSGTTARQAVAAPAPVLVKPKPKPRPTPQAPAHPAPPAERDLDSDTAGDAPAPTIISSTATLDVASVIPPVNAAPPVPASGDMPALPTAGPPTTLPPPPDDADAPVNPFPVKPYGDTVVVAFKIDSNGQILDSRILVPSWNSLGDMSIRLAAQSNAAKSIRYTNINPPIQPGENRWIVIPHSWESTSGSSLP